MSDEIKKVDEVVDNPEPKPINIVYDVHGKMRASDLETPADFTPPEELYKELIEKIKAYHPSEDFSMIEKAYKLADEAHKGQKRKSGEPYIIHPVKATKILMDLRPDLESIQTCLLHDVIEDCTVTKEEIAQEFGPDVANLCE